MASALYVVVNELDGEVKAHHGDECVPDFSTGHHNPITPQDRDIP
ncbi:hypothetical protein ACMSWQ_000741 [Cronobacter sakazakii]